MCTDKKRYKSFHKDSILQKGPNKCQICIFTPTTAFVPFSEYTISTYQLLVFPTKHEVSVFTWQQKYHWKTWCTIKHFRYSKHIFKPNTPHHLSKFDIASMQIKHLFAKESGLGFIFLPLHTVYGQHRVKCLVT